MTIVIAGGTGFLGGALAAQLQRDGHDTVSLTRGGAGRGGRDGDVAVKARASAGSGADRTAGGGGRRVVWSPDGSVGPWAETLDGADVVVNLAGASIAGGRWNEERKRQIRDSRVLATRSLAAAIGQAKTPPPLLVSGSAVGYYGACGDEIVDESHRAGTDFLAGVCVRWESEAMAAASDRTRVVCIRTGLVLDRRGGALPSMLFPFKLGVGGRLGDGRQYMPWIHKQDWLNLAAFLIARRDAIPASGPVNATAPAPVRNLEFTRSLAKVLHRPALLPAPAFALRLLLGEMADGLLLSGQRAVPDAVTRLGFRFAYANLDAALHHLLAS